MGKNSKFGEILTSLKRKMPNMWYKSLHQSQTNMFSLMLLCSDSHIQQHYSMDMFRPKVICTGHKWKYWRSVCWTAYNSNTAICCDTPSCTALAFCRECADGRQEWRHTTPIYLFWRNVHRPVANHTFCYFFGTH